MDEKLSQEEIQEIQYELGSECCGYDLKYENDGIGICGNCQEWAGYISEEEIKKDRTLWA